MRFPQPTGCARVLVPKNRRLASHQPASPSVLLSSPTEFICSPVDASLGCDWAPLSWRLALSSGCSKLRPGLHDRIRTRFPQTPIIRDECCLGYQRMAPRRMVINPEQQLPYLQGTAISTAVPIPGPATACRSQYTDNVRSRSQGWQTYLGTVQPGTCRFRVVSHPGSRVPPLPVLFQLYSTRIARPRRRLRESHVRSLSVRTPRCRDATYRPGEAWLLNRDSPRRRLSHTDLGRLLTGVYPGTYESGYHPAEHLICSFAASSSPSLHPISAIGCQWKDIRRSIVIQCYDPPCNLPSLCSRVMAWDYFSSHRRGTIS